MLAQGRMDPIEPVGENIRPAIAAVIPSLKGRAEKLIERLKQQTWAPDEIQVVEGVRPNGLARNMGVAALKKTPGDGTDRILLFIDDDATPGTPDLVEKLVTPLVQPPAAGKSAIGISGVARILPKNATWFQRRVAAEIPRTVNPIPAQMLETNPPLRGYGHSMITTTCCAMWQTTYQEVGGFSDHLISGVDTDFFYRVRSHGYRFVMQPAVYVEHPAPKSVAELWRKFFWYGLGYSQEVQRRPEQKMGIPLPTWLHRLGFLSAATLWLVPNIFILYSYSYPRIALGFRPLKALSTYAVAWGYVAGWRGETQWPYR